MQGSLTKPNSETRGNYLPLQNGNTPAAQAVFEGGLTLTLTLTAIELLHIGNLSEKRLPRAATLPNKTSFSKLD